MPSAVRFAVIDVEIVLQEIPRFTEEELALFPGKAVTLLIEALRTYVSTL